MSVLLCVTSTIRLVASGVELTPVVTVTTALPDYATCRVCTPGTGIKDQCATWYTRSSTTTCTRQQTGWLGGCRLTGFPPTRRSFRCRFTLCVRRSAGTTSLRYLRVRLAGGPGFRCSPFCDGFATPRHRRIRMRSDAGPTWMVPLFRSRVEHLKAPSCSWTTCVPPEPRWNSARGLLPRWERAQCWPWCSPAPEL